MVANPLFDLLPPVSPEHDSGSVPTLPEEAQPAPTTEPPLSEKVGGELVNEQLSRDGRFRWNAVWGSWVPTGKGEEIDLPGPLEWGPLMPDRLHPRGCWCVACWNTGLQYGEYLKAKRMWP